MYLCLYFIIIPFFFLFSRMFISLLLPWELSMGYDLEEGEKLAHSLWLYDLVAFPGLHF